MIADSAIVFVETGDRVCYVSQMLFSFELGLRSNLVSELRTLTSHMVINVFFRAINIASVCGASHQIIRPKRWLVSNNNSWGRVALNLLPTYRLACSSRCFSCIVHKNGSSTFWALALTPVGALILIKSVHRLTDIISSTRESIALKSTLHVWRSARNWHASCVYTSSPWVLKFSECDELISFILWETTVSNGHHNLSLFDRVICDLLLLLLFLLLLSHLTVRQVRILTHFFIFLFILLNLLLGSHILSGLSLDIFNFHKSLIESVIVAWSVLHPWVDRGITSIRHMASILLILLLLLSGTLSLIFTIS